MARILFYLQKNKLSPRGGPLGVGYYYWDEMKKRNESTIDFIENDSTTENIMGVARKIVGHLPKKIYDLQHSLRDIKRIKKLLKDPSPLSEVDLNKYSVIQFHETMDLYLEKKNLENYKGIVILQSHSPLPAGMEKTLDYSKIYHRLIPNLGKKLEEIDRYAFERADYLVFPCKEAEEPYIDNWDYYKIIKEEKKDKYLYIETGIKPATALRVKKVVREELHIPMNDFVVFYAGRHNIVKGYNSLKTIGRSFLEKSEDNWIVVAGRLGPIESPDYKRWIEIGWTTDAHSYMAAADVFILPNKVTYFDLVFIEAMSLGMIILASRTGGNKYYEKFNLPGVFLYDNEKEAVDCLQRIKNMSEEERNTLRKINKEFYAEHLTVSKMYDNYFNAINKIDDN
ncbi:Glycosyltransferase involved in cell wall bisynthesis [Pseudobutyrivibrio sp. C4]|uniref:glycosyltransferase family 4 protein n=1 Tax=Pseudobutyrivibrio sp. C4 TaxID=1520803 RepID=UPI0008BDE425|nr:glycosyltransferase family 4 protein [Pseudobutyrivibrio sp. C4]SET25745.1 Glycosyltransferase involved in cell wall bisynthesis [Pseudobutyrivibrio sp. C4]